MVEYPLDFLIGPIQPHSGASLDNKD